MWTKLSIKIQLIIFMTLVVTIVEVSTLFIIHNLQKTESQKNSISEVDTVTKSLNNDLLKFMLNPNATMLSDITYRLLAFKKINGLILYNANNEAIFKYAQIENIQKNKKLILNQKNIFNDDNLFIKKELTVEGYTFGFTILDISLAEYKEKQKNITYTILGIFPFALLFGFLVSLGLSQSYTKPFLRLLKAMKKSDPIKGNILVVKTDASNEIKDLFDGFNNQMQQIATSTKELHFQAEHDQLTNIYNRFFMENELQKALKDETNLEYSLLAIDLDQFKLINDSVGFQAGNEFLKIITSEYSNMLPKDSIFARVDGDGFMVLLQNSSQEDGISFLKESLEKLRDFRFIWNNETHTISASIGLVSFKSFQYTLKELLKASNSSLYSAKAQGKNKSHVYDISDDITKRFDREAQTATYLKEALKGGASRFELFAQDIVPLQYETSQVSYEILIRMWDKDNNFVSPDDFLPTAQRFQLMAEIDIFVLWNYLETVTVNEKHIENLHSAHINLAGSSLNNPDFQAKVKEAVKHFNFPWEKLELEVTESSAIGNFTKANEFIAWLKSVGIGLALDDFGTGMASFEYLKNLPFDVVKIDGSFVKDMHKDPIDKAVIKYIQEIATLKGQETVAEYVETIEDVEELRKIGITYGQGYFLGKPRALSSWLD
jgi:diguanylate cyclase (GGDEF)-like protein